jgi:hypothetical protein
VCTQKFFFMTPMKTPSSGGNPIMQESLSGGTPLEKKQILRESRGFFKEL